MELQGVLVAWGALSGSRTEEDEEVRWHSQVEAWVEVGLSYPDAWDDPLGDHGHMVLWVACPSVGDRVGACQAVVPGAG